MIQYLYYIKCHRPADITATDCCVGDPFARLSGTHGPFDYHDAVTFVEKMPVGVAQIATVYKVPLESVIGGALGLLES